jgi:UDP-glucuronate decarboxylase
MRELAELVIELTGSRSKIVHRPLPQDDPRQRRPDISRANTDLKWAPQTPLRQGLAQTIAYFEQLLGRATGRFTSGSFTYRTNTQRCTTCLGASASSQTDPSERDLASS